MNRAIRAGLVLFLIAYVFRVIDLLWLRLDETVVRHLPSKVLGIMVLLLYLRVGRWSVADVGLARLAVGRNVLLGLLASTLFGLTAYGVPLAMLRSAGVATTWSPKAAVALSGSGLIFLLLFHVCNAFLEEGLFRGIMLRQLLTRFSPVRSNLLQAGFFGLWHIVWPVKWALYGGGTGSFPVDAVTYVASTALVGIFFGALTLRTGSLWAPVVIHATSGIWNDFFQLVELGTRTQWQPLGGILVVVVPLAVLGFVYLIHPSYPLRVTPWGAPPHDSRASGA